VCEHQRPSSLCFEFVYQPRLINVSINEWHAPAWETSCNFDIERSVMDSKATFRLFFSDFCYIKERTTTTYKIEWNNEVSSVLLQISWKYKNLNLPILSQKCPTMAKHTRLIIQIILTTNTFNLHVASWWPSIPVCISLLKHVGVLALTLDN